MTRSVRVENIEVWWIPLTDGRRSGRTIGVTSKRDQKTGTRDS